MSITETAYEAGVQQALHDYTEKRAGFVDRFLGRNVRKAVGEQTKKVMELPAITRHGTPEELSSFRSYVKGSLKEKPSYLPARADKPHIPSDKELFREMKETLGQKPSSAEFAEYKANYAPAIGEGAAEQGSIIEQLLAGQKAVKAETAATRRARLGLGAAAIPAIGAPFLLKESVDLETAAPMGAGIAAGSLPIAQGLSSKALSLRRPGGKLFKDPAELQKLTRRGDIFLESAPGWKPTGPYKPLISLMGADPTGGYHAGVVERTPSPEGIRKELTKRLGRAPTPFDLRDAIASAEIESIEAGPEGRAAVRNRGELTAKKDFVVRRFKDTKHVEPFMKNVMRMHGREEVIDKILGAEATRRMYDKPTSIKAGIGSLLPTKAQQWLAKISPADPGRAVCSSMPGLCSPTELMKGVPGEHVMPHHILRSPELETVGRYVAPRTLKQKVIDLGLRASPWALRGALGAGLGYGAYRGIKALLD